MLEKASLTDTISRNLRFMAASRFVSLLVSFTLFPFVVKHAGQEIYGLYLIVITLTGYFGLIDLGVISALTKYVSEYTGRGDKEKVNNIINASFTFYVLAGITVCVSLMVISRYLHLFFNIPPHETPLARNLVVAASISSLFLWPLTTFRGALEGLNLWNVEAVVNMAVQSLTALSAYIAFSLGYSILVFFVLTQLFAIVGHLFFFFLTRKKTSFRLKFPFLDRRTFKLIFGFSIFMFLSSLVNIFLFQVHNLIIGLFLSLSAVTLYAVAYNLQSYFRYINSTLGGPPWTVASELEGKKDYEGQKLLLLKGTKYLTALFIPAVIITIILVDPLIKYWMGPGFEESVLPARIVITFWLFNGTIELAIGMLSAKGIVRESLYIQLLVAVVNIAISLLLIKTLGILAIALGLTLSMVFVGVPLYLRLSLKTLGLSLRAYFRDAVKNNLITYLLAAALSLAALFYLYPTNLYITVLEMGVVYVFTLVFHYFFILDKQEKAEIVNITGLKKLKAMMGKV